MLTYWCSSSSNQTLVGRLSCAEWRRVWGVILQWDHVEMQESTACHRWHSLDQGGQKRPKSVSDQKTEAGEAALHFSQTESWYHDRTNVQTGYPCALAVKRVPRDYLDAAPCHGICWSCMRTSTDGCTCLHVTRPWCWVVEWDWWYPVHAASHMWCSWHREVHGGRFDCFWCWGTSSRHLRSHVHPPRKQDHGHEQGGGLSASWGNPAISLAGYCWVTLGIPWMQDCPFVPQAKLSGHQPYTRTLQLNNDQKGKCACIAAVVDSNHSADWTAFVWHWPFWWTTQLPPGLWCSSP